MEGEIRNFIAVWITVMASLCYCHAIGKFISKGTSRLFTILPIIFLFLYLPLRLTTIHLGAPTTFLIAWLGTFKLLLFAFGKGPLSSDSSISLPRFILLGCLPIKPQQSQSKEKQNPSLQTRKLPLNYAAKIMLLSVILRIYKYKEQLHPKIILVLYCLHIYVALELLLAIFAALARALGRLELEPQFDEPYLSTSLQDFWGRRWNLVVTGILRSTVYDPVRSFSTRLIGRKGAQFLATMATFFVSGVMHELIFCYSGRMKPTLEVTSFFLIHGVCLVLEIRMKKALNGKFRVPPVVSTPATLAFVVVTSLWLFFPPVLRFDADVIAQREAAAFLVFVKDVFGVSSIASSNITMKGSLG
ncbi:hypothetical protein U1Q18_011002 [Sarracenia purpurea var. burkii]